ncbi:MAG: HD-GYP domain-containing protein [Gemmatimonadaceae bacterium]
MKRIVENVAAGAVLASAASLAYADVPTLEQWYAAGFFTAFGLLACILVYQTSNTTSGSIGFLPFLSIAVISPNFAALASVFVSILGAELISRREPIKAVFNVAQYVFAEALAIAVYLSLGGQSILDSQPPILAFLGMVATFLMVNKLAVSTVVSAASGSDTRQHWLQSMRQSAPYDLLAFPLILFVAVAYDKLGPQWSAALAIPILGMRQIYKSNIALHKINEELLQLIVAAIEARDPYTSGHSQRVAKYARVIARSSGLGGRAAERVVVAALLHDVGKIHEEFAPILRKPGKLTDSEYEIMKTHSEKSAVLVGKVSHFADLVPLIHAHHEEWDGSGYPLGLAGASIPLGARIIALADTIDAMSTSRPYRRAMTSDEVKEELRRESGFQFDPAICTRVLTDVSWRELTREIVIATAEYPVAREVEELASKQTTPRLLQLRS